MAAFATSPAWRLGLAAVLTALFLGVSAAAFVRVAWWPVLQTAVHVLPGRGELRLGELTWSSPPATAPLAENGFLAVVLNPSDAPVSPPVADVWVELRRGEIGLHGLFGFTRLPYDRRWELVLDRPNLEPVLAAWRPHATVGVAAVAALGWLAVWSVVALVLALPLRAYAGLLRREATLAGCWRLGMAALLAGTLLIAAALLLYARRSFTVTDFLLAFALAHVVDLLLLLGAPWRLPRRQVSSPFAANSPPESSGLEPPEAAETLTESAATEERTSARNPRASERSPFNAAGARTGTGNPFSGGGTSLTSGTAGVDPPASKPRLSGEEPINPS